MDGNPRFLVYNYDMLLLQYELGRCNDQYQGHRHGQVVGMESILQINEEQINCYVIGV